MKRIRKNSLYDISNNYGTQRKNEGFDYKSNQILLKKTLSPYMFRNDDLAEFLEMLNELHVLNTESIKIIRVFNNFTVHKNTKYIN